MWPLDDDEEQTRANKQFRFIEQFVSLHAKERCFASGIQYQKKACDVPFPVDS